MKYDYGPIVAKAKVLADRFGTAVHLVKLDVPASVEKPWEGSSPGTPVEYTAVFAQPGKLGLNVEVNDFLKKSSQVAIIVTTDELSVYDKMIFQGKQWKITGMSSLRPAGSPLLWYVGLSE